jgi:hypothetical protein
MPGSNGGGKIESPARRSEILIFSQARVRNDAQIPCQMFGKMFGKLFTVLPNISERRVGDNKKEQHRL